MAAGEPPQIKPFYQDESHYKDLEPGVGLLSKPKPKDLRFYRANKDLKGFASKWQISRKEHDKYTDVMVFLVMSPQVGYDDDGNGKFNWDGAITVKLGVADLGEILAVLEGRKDSAGYKGSLYHETPGGGNKALKFDFADGVYKLSVSAQTADKQRVGPFYQTLSAGEGAVLTVMLKKAIEQIHNW